MTITTQTDVYGKLIISIEGQIDTVTSPQFRKVSSGIPNDVPGIILDFAKVNYVSSAGLRELLILRKRFRDERMSVINVNERVLEIFANTGFDTIIPVEVSTPSDYSTVSIKDFLKRKVEEASGKTAVVFDDVPYTWKDMDLCSGLAAAELRNMGVTKGSHVALCGINSINWIILFFAIQRLGAIALLINPSQLAEEIGNTAKIGDAAFICYGELIEMKEEDKFLEKLSEVSGVRRDRFYSFGNTNLLRERATVPDAARFEGNEGIEADDTAVMIFTSGSTGRPKGVLISAFNLMTAAMGNSRDQTLTEDDRTCLILPMFHIFGLVAGLLSNAIAGSVIYIPNTIRTDSIIEMIDKYRCTVFHSVPTLLIAIINNKKFDPEKLVSVRCTILSGASASESQIEMFTKALPNDHFFSSYGLSEMAPVSITAYEDTDDHVFHTVGKPIKDIELCIFDIETGAECAPGKKGEICVQGDNLMTGYYKMSLDDQSIDDEGWLHTGDLGYLREDGYLCFVGRIKEIIIRGGENIMPGEVESVLSSFEMVDNVKVIGIPDDFYGETVCACIIPKDGMDFDKTAVLKLLSDKLARYKIPSRFEIFDAFPMLGTGKIDAVTLKRDVLSRIVS